MSLNMLRKRGTIVKVKSQNILSLIMLILAEIIYVKRLTLILLIE